MRRKRYTIECVPLLDPPMTWPPIAVRDCHTSTGVVTEYRRLSKEYPAYHFWVRKNW